MCCFVMLLGLLGPRFAFLYTWIFTTRVHLAFSGACTGPAPVVIASALRSRHVLEPISAAAVQQPRDRGVLALLAPSRVPRRQRLRTLVAPRDQRDDADDDLRDERRCAPDKVGSSRCT